MCYLLTQVGQPAQALFYARRADSLRPGSPPLLNNLAGEALIDKLGQVAAVGHVGQPA